MKTKSRYLFPLCMVILIMIPGGCVNTPISATATFSPTTTITSTALSQPEEKATITPAAMVPQTEQVESVLPGTLREMEFIPNDATCNIADLDQIQLDGEILFASDLISGGGDTINVGVGGLVNINNLYWNDEMLEAIRASDDGRWTVALFQDQVGHTTFLEATGWVLINNLSGELYQGVWDLEEEYYYMDWEIYSSDESGVQMLLFPTSASNQDRYLSELKLFILPVGEVRDLGLDTETRDIFCYGKYLPPITFSPQRDKVIFFTFNIYDRKRVHTLLDIKNNQELWHVPENMQHPHLDFPFWLWAPDSSRIAMPFHQILINTDEILQADLYMLDSEATSMERLTTFRESIDGKFTLKPLSWSEDSRKLLVLADEWVVGGRELRYYILDFEQNQIIQSCQFQWTRAFNGLWSADGSRVIFEMGDLGEGYKLVEMNANSGDANIAETEYYWLKLLYWYQD